MKINLLTPYLRKLEYREDVLQLCGACPERRLPAPPLSARKCVETHHVGLLRLFFWHCWFPDNMRATNIQHSQSLLHILPPSIVTLYIQLASYSWEEERRECHNYQYLENSALANFEAELEINFSKQIIRNI